MKLTHDQLASDLATHLRGNSKRITWEDMQLGPSGSPRPDVYTMEPTYTRLTFEAFECKVSMSDFRADVTAGKWQSYLLYANSVTFAVPAGLVTKDMVPASCGLIVRGPSGEWRYQKKPVRQVLTELPWQAWIKLLLDGTERAGQILKRDRWASYLANEKLGQKFGAEVAKMVSDLQRLPSDYEYEKERHKALLQDLAKQREEARQNDKERREALEQRCSNTVGKLAVALGLPADALLTDLQSRAQQVLRILEGGSRYSGHPLMAMAERMDELSKDLRAAGEALSRHVEDLAG